MPKRKSPPPRPEAMHPEIDGALRDAHVVGLQQGESVALYDALCEQLAVQGQCNPATQKMLRDACHWEDIIVVAQADIRKRGVMVDFEQGAQKIRCANKSLQQLKTAQEQQRKIFTLLRLTPNTRGRVAQETEVQEDEEGVLFDDF